jgi:hypothetical protein
MANLNKQLKKLFHDYLNRKENERLHPNVEHKPYQPKLFSGEFTGVIYFYEWSDATRTPKTFYQLEKFEDFLEQCNIYLLGWQREIIKNMHNPYISCKKGEKELIIKVSYEALKAALLDDSIDKGNPFRSTGAPGFNPMAMPQKGSEDKEPYQVAITRPRMVFEPDSRYPDMMPQGLHEEFWDW